VAEALCTLQYAVGRIEDCPGERCPFWLGDKCLFAGVVDEIERKPSLAQHLLELRLALASAASEPPGRSLFYRLA
jgi:hypothetical protein